MRNDFLKLLNEVNEKDIQTNIDNDYIEVIVQDIDNDYNDEDIENLFEYLDYNAKYSIEEIGYTIYFTFDNTKIIIKWESMSWAGI